MVNRPYWYLTTIEYCPVCGRETTYRERQYTEKPQDATERFHIKEVYDYCEEGIF